MSQIILITHKCNVLSKSYLLHSEAGCHYRQHFTQLFASVSFHDCEGSLIAIMVSISSVTTDQGETRDKAMAISPSALWIPFSSPLFCSMKYTDQSANRTLTAITDFSLLIHQAWLEQNLPSLSTAIRREGEQQKQGKGMISVTPLMGFTYVWIFLCMPVDTANLCFCL